jgi:hypothetical protein
MRHDSSTLSAVRTPLALPMLSCDEKESEGLAPGDQSHADLIS